MITTRTGYARALSSSLLPLHPATLYIPHAESSAQAARRAYLHSARRGCISTFDDFRRKGKTAERWAGYATSAVAEREDPERDDEDCVSPAIPIRRDRQEEAADRALARNWPVESNFPFHIPPPSYRLDRTESCTSKPPKLSAPLQPVDLEIPALSRNPLIAPLEEPWTSKRFRDRFRYVAKSSPWLAFLSLRDLPEASLKSLVAEDIDILLRRFFNMQESETRQAIRVDRKESLVVLERLLHHLQMLSPKHRPTTGYTSGTRLRGRRLRQFLMLCVIFRAEQLAYDTFVNHFPDQIISGLSPTDDLDEFAYFLSRQRQYGLLIDCFTHPSFPTSRPHIPLLYWSSKLVLMVGQAFLAMRREEALLALGRMYEKMLTSAGSAMDNSVQTLLLQASVSTGSHDTAKRLRRSVAHASSTSGALDFDAQLAIVRGQKALGLDAVFERKVLSGLPAHPAQAAQLIQELVIIRLNSKDAAGAQRLLSRFDLTSRITDVSEQASSGSLSPTPRIITLAFETVALRPNINILTAWWKYLTNNPQYLTDSAISHLIRAMSSVGLVEEAYLMLRSHLSGYTPLSPIWHLPQPVDIGIISLNALAECMTRAQGLNGLQSATDLMRASRVDADGKTIKIVLDAVRRNMTTRPDDLVKLLSVMLERANNVRAQIGHIDSIMAEAVKLASFADRSSFFSTDAQYPLKDPTGGLVPIEQYAVHVDHILESLRERAVASEPLTIATRLRFEALVADHAADIPIVEKVWDEFMEMGYRPDKRHLLALMQGYAAAGQMEQAERVKRLAVKLDVQPTSGMYMVLLTGWARLGGRGIDKARAAYEAIKAAANEDKSFGFDIVTVSAMIQAYYSARMWHTAATVARTDLAALSEQRGLDDKATLIGMTALRWCGDESAALDLLEKRDQPALNFFLRVAVRRIRVHLERKLANNRGGIIDRTSLSRANRILQRDTQARPYILPGSLFTAPAGDTVPNKRDRKSIKQRFDLSHSHDAWIANMISPTRPIAVPRTTLQSLFKMIDVTTSDAPTTETIRKIQTMIDDHRQLLAAELVSLRSERSRRTSKLVLTPAEKAMVDQQMEVYEESLVRMIENGSGAEASEPGPATKLPVPKSSADGVNVYDYGGVGARSRLAKSQGWWIGNTPRPPRPKGPRSPSIDPVDPKTPAEERARRYEEGREVRRAARARRREEKAVVKQLAGTLESQLADQVGRT